MPLSQHALLNVEGFIALGFVALLFIRGGEVKKSAAGFDALGLAIATTIIALAVSLAFAPILRAPFLYDDYTHITDASHFTWRSVAQQFEPVTGRGLFFRPVGFFLYWLNYLWAGANPVWWHASSIALHAICSCLVYALCRELGVSRWASLGGALLFASTGLAAETVGWIDARFDLMTTALVLASLLCIGRGWVIGGLALGAAGMLCKESGFCLPLLIAALALFRSSEERRPIWRAAAWAGLVAAILFAYRWWAIGGIGGYGAPAGEANILHFNLLHTLNALLLRQWAILFFPFNWSAPSSPILRAAVVAIPFILATCAWMARAPRRLLAGCVIFIIAAGLPVQHMLLLGASTGGSRQLYLGSVGLALLWAVVLDSMAWRPRIIFASLLACLLLAIGGWILEHNLSVWRDTAELARSVCVSFGKTAGEVPGTIVVRGLPATRMGVVFLNNGFPQCVEMNAGVPAWRIQVGDEGVAPSDAHEFVWNDDARRIEEARHR
ncbi:MAG: hypothetical protein ACLPWF_28930 [Bryobacteraceae bacterium]